MKRVKLSMFAVCVSILFASCSVIGLNMKRKTPANPAKYPEFTMADTLRGMITQYRKDFDVIYYDIHLDVDIEKKYLKGFVDIYFKALDDIDTLQIDLYDNMKVNGICFNSDSLRFIRKFNAVLVDLSGKVRENDLAMIRVFYEGQPQKAARPPWDGGFVWKKDKDGNPWIGVACELDGASLWWPVKDHLYDEPDSLTMNVTVPQGLFCVSNGLLQQRIKENGKETFIWKTLYPINTYNASIYIGNFQHFTLPYKKQDSVLNLDFYVLPYNLDKAKSHFQQASEIIRFYEMRFGDYPWWNEDYKLVESPYKGMENQTAIAYGNDYKNWMGKNFDYIILHETAHEWWGNSVSASDYAEIWMHEGFATYSEALYVEHKEGYNAYLRYLNFYSLLIKNKQPVIGPYDVNYWNYKDGDVYFKGALLLHTLRNVIDNDSLFFDIIRTFYNENKYTITSTKKFIELVNLKTGMDFKWFFDQYLYNRASPLLEWQYGPDREGKSYVLYYRWGNVNADFKLPVAVNADGKPRIIYPTAEIQVLKLSTGDPVTLNLFNSYIALKERFNLNLK